MRTPAVLALLVSLSAAAAEAPDALEDVARFAGAGAARLALSRLEELQPRVPSAPRWAEWEMLRLDLLAQLERHEALLERVAKLPRNLAQPSARRAAVLAARAAVAAGRGALARRQAARVLWQLGPAPDEAREMRLIVIESYVGEKKGDEAFRGMLRYQQDFKPLERAVATRFVRALLDLDMDKEAATWFAQLDDSGPLKLLLRFKAGLVPAETAVSQARTALARRNDASYWEVLLHAAARHNNRALEIEALEQMLNAVEPKNAAPRAAVLWQRYLAAAQDIGNQNQLLMGDDANWADFASRRLGTSPHLSRAFFAYLAQRGQTLPARLNAQLQLAFSLQQSRLELAGVRLFGDEKLFPLAALDAQARALLGGMADNHNLYALAARFWQGLDTPPGVDPDDWRLKVATVMLRAGLTDGAAAAVRRMLADRGMLPEKIAQRCLALLNEMFDAAQFRTANELLKALLPLAAGGVRRETHFALGRIATHEEEFQAAAYHFLQAALAADGKHPDRLALEARLHAALSLARAGLPEDAKSQFQWLLKNLTDPVQLEIVRRELQKL